MDMRKLTLTPVLLLIGLSALSAPAALAQADIHVVRAGDTLEEIAQRYGTTVTEVRLMNNLRSDNISNGQRLVVRRAGRGFVFDAEGEQPADVGPSLPGVRPDNLVAPERIPTGPPPPPPPPASISLVELGPGASLPLPTTRVADEAPGERVEARHTVAAGETLFSIAQRYGSTVDAIRQANSIQGDRIGIGQVLVVPGAGSTPRPVAQRPAPGRYNVNRSTVPDDEIHTVLPGETLFSIAERYGTTAGRLLTENSVNTGPLVPGLLMTLPDGVGREHHRTPAPKRVDEDGLALIYPASYVGRTTISGEAYDPQALTASHRSAPFGTILLVTAAESGKQTLVRVNDRGPVAEGFLIELSEAAARALGLTSGSAERVEVKVLR